MFTLCLALVLPAFADDKEKKDKDKPESSSSPGSSLDKPLPKDKLVYVARLQGQVTDIDLSSGHMSLFIHYKSPNKAAFQKMAQLQQREMQQEMQIMRTMMQQVSRAMSQRGGGRGRSNYNYRNNYNRNNRGQNTQAQLGNTINQMMRVAPTLYDDKTATVGLMLGEDMNVRVAAPPDEKDEKGRRKLYSPEDLKAIKGNTKMWGYPGDIEKIEVGSIVQVFIARKKVPHAPGHRETEEEMAENPPLVKVIYLSPLPPQPLEDATSPGKTTAKPAPKAAPKKK
jgi:hypothetical protein